jgi:hypothetical protein
MNDERDERDRDQQVDCKRRHADDEPQHHPAEEEKNTDNDPHATSRCNHRTVRTVASERRVHVSRYMLSMLSNMFLGRRRSGFLGLFDRRRRGGVVNGVNNHRGASAIGALATVAAPFLIRKLMHRRAQNAHVS